MILIIKITANHAGTFRIKLCPLQNPRQIATQQCKDQNVLELMNPVSSNPSKNVVLVDSFTVRIIEPLEALKVNLSARLPNGLICDNCVIQWQYYNFLYKDSLSLPYPDRFDNGSLVQPLVSI